VVCQVFHYYYIGRCEARLRTLIVNVYYSSPILTIVKAPLRYGMLLDACFHYAP